LLGPPPTTQPWLAGSYGRARGSGSPPSSRRSYRRARCAARRRFASSTQAVTLVLLLIPAWLRAALGCVVDAGALLLLQAHRLLLDPPLGCLRSFLSSALRLRLRDRHHATDARSPTSSLGGFGQASHLPTPHCLSQVATPEGGHHGLPLAGPYGWGDPAGTRTATYSTSAVGAPLALSVSPVQEGRTCDAVPPLTPAIEPCHLTCPFCFFVFVYVDFTNGDICLCPQRLLRDRVRSAVPEP